MFAGQATIFLLCGAVFTAQGNSQTDKDGSQKTHLWNQLKAIAESVLNNPGEYYNIAGITTPEHVKSDTGAASKRGFDSIGHNNHFGGAARGIGRSTSGDDEDLVFTFESLFPVIARQLRSRNK